MVLGSLDIQPARILGWYVYSFPSLPACVHADPLHCNRRSTAMDGLAVEVIEKIAAFACTDGGRTGLSLSLTSKYIREATRAVRFHSVSLTKGPKQVSQFSSHFNAERVALSDRTVPRILWLTG